jgi:DNA-binding transcriptional LysR family regulator
VSVADIQGEPLILREQGSGIRHVIVRQAEEQGLNLNVLLEASSVPFIKDLVSRGAGVSILTRISAEEEVKAGIIAAVSFAEGGLWVHVDMALPREGHRTAAVRSLLEYLTETAGVDDLRNTGEAPAASGPEA